MGNFLFGFTLHHAHYIFIRVTNDLVYYREGSRQCCLMSLSALLFDKLGSSACCHRTTENVDHILEFAGRTYTRYRNAFHKQSPFRCTLDCREQQSGRLATTLRAKTGRLNTTSLTKLDSNCFTFGNCY